MKDQHTKIKGYRDLSQEEIDDMNEVKRVAEEVGTMIKALECKAQLGTLDGRWIAIAKTHLQQGMMAAVRSIAQQETF